MQRGEGIAKAKGIFFRHKPLGLRANFFPLWPIVADHESFQAHAQLLPMRYLLPQRRTGPAP
jgi:hypothetical protein